MDLIRASGEQVKLKIIRDMGAQVIARSVTHTRCFTFQHDTTPVSQRSIHAAIPAFPSNFKHRCLCVQAAQHFHLTLSIDACVYPVQAAQQVSSLNQRPAGDSRGPCGYCEEPVMTSQRRHKNIEGGYFHQVGCCLIININKS